LQQFRQKLIVYAAYIDTPYTNPKLREWHLTHSLINFPKTLLSPVWLTSAGVNTHGVMRWQSQLLAKAPLWNPNTQKTEETGAFRYNDGVLPLSSQLYLPQRTTPYTESVYEYTQLHQNKFVRVFYNLDHVDLGHYRWPEAPLNTWDVFHPHDGKRTPLEWFFYDLTHLDALDTTILYPHKG
jgi:hypothetical protein